MDAVIDEIYESGEVIDEVGERHSLNSHIDRKEGEFLHGLISADASIKRTLEVGCAYGLSSLHITTALRGREGARHTIIDPFQTSDWKRVGVTNLRRAGVDYFELIEDGSEFVLPQLAKTHAGEFDLVFIDGCHTFDHTLVDMFFANRLIHVGGYIVLDDCCMAPVAKAVSYAANYPCYQLHSQSEDVGMSPKRRISRKLFNVIPSAVWKFGVPKKVYDTLHRARYSNMVALKKVAADERSWNWFADF